MLEINNLEFGYNNPCCLYPASFSIKKGDFLAILGVNGIGKSTLVKTILGQLPPIKGSILVDGKNLSSISLKDRSKLISIVTANFSTSLNLSVKDILNHANIINQNRFGFKGKKSFENDMIKLFKRLDLTGLLTEKFNKISSGQQQLVLIARAILQNTKMIFLDEPTAFLDVKNKLKIFELLQELRKEGKTIFLISHDLNLVYNYSNKILFLDKDKVEIVEKNSHDLQYFYDKFLY